MIYDATFGIAVLLGTGLAVAKLAQMLRLPSVTGFILAGLLLGESGLGLMTTDLLGHQLDHFTSIALMLIAFGIGEHVELRRLDGMRKNVAYIALLQALVGFTVVMLVTLYITWLTSGTGKITLHQVILSILLGAISVATAPATILHVIRELGARGPKTSTLLAVVAATDAIAIMVFGIAVSTAHNLAGTEGLSLSSLLFCLYEIGGSLLVGILTGLIIDKALDKLHNNGEMLTAGLALLLLCGELTRQLHLSSLLAGMIAGFVMINRAERDVRLFRIINGFEPPIYVLFFTLAGVHLDLSALKLAGWVGIAYFLARIIGKYCGSWLGAYLSGATKHVRNYLGLSLIPQAGVAIGFVFMVSTDPKLADWSSTITPVVLAGVVLAELCGPVLVRITMEKAGEINQDLARKQSNSFFTRLFTLKDSQGASPSLEPWSLGEIQPPASPVGVVVVGTWHFATARALTRVATILAHHFDALPLAVRAREKEEEKLSEEKLRDLFLPETDEASLLGYPIQTEVLYDKRATALIAATQKHNAKALVLGYPISRAPLKFQRVLDPVSSAVHCPIIAVRFVGTMTWERILIPFIQKEELKTLLPIIEAMITSCHPQLTFQQLLFADSTPDEIRSTEKKLESWANSTVYDADSIRCLAEASESPLESILREARYHDLIIMTASELKGMKRCILGSLANVVVENCKNPVFVVYPGKAQD
ncbi:MAG: cation:proton antiporter [Candidatus Electrothrix aestuarii]|uniref:Cation:proton antiporter n=1 Tax=Candidatus Electrothrix aestuarii TaxID=3062594 RepID=A0AAU8LSG8_9BACT|nr:cation:proton antiporter [Candidatus Electrothrix aestuarii]